MNRKDVWRGFSRYGKYRWTSDDAFEGEGIRVEISQLDNAGSVCLEISTMDARDYFECAGGSAVACYSCSVWSKAEAEAACIEVSALLRTAAPGEPPHLADRAELDVTKGRHGDCGRAAARTGQAQSLDALFNSFRERTPRAVTPKITRKLRSITTADPVFIDVTPQPGARAANCYQNVRHVVCGRGGRMVEGWLIWEGGDGSYLKCIHHAVWESPDGHLVDVTPTDDERNLFLPDPATHYAGEFIRARYLPLTSNPFVRQQIEFCIMSDRLLRHPCPCGGGQGSKHSPDCEWVDRAAPVQQV